MTRLIFALIVIGFSASLQAKTRTENFGDVRIGSRSSKTLYFRNRTWGDLEFERFYFAGGKPFSYSTNCNRYLPEGHECWVTVTMAPTKVKNYAATLEVSYTSGKSSIFNYVGRGVRN